MSEHLLRVWAYYRAITTGLPTPVQNWHFEVRWSLAVAWPDYRVGIDVLNTYLSPAGETFCNVEDVCKKQAAAILAGWEVFWITPGMLSAYPRHTIQMIADYLAAKGKAA